MSSKYSKMDSTRIISSESLYNFNANQNKSFVANTEMNFDVSLSDIYDTISLYDYDQNDDSKNTKRLTWEEWYLKKKIQNLKNENKLQDDMKKKISSNSKYNSMTEEEKNKKLMDWIHKKRKQKKNLEEKLKKVQEENEKKKEKKEADKVKSIEKYNEWLEHVKKKEHEDREKQKEQERKQKEKEELEKQKKLEAEKRLIENRKELIKVRPLSKRSGVAIVNGKLRNFFDWSTSPDPSYINRAEWKS